MSISAEPLGICSIAPYWSAMSETLLGVVFPPTDCSQGADPARDKITNFWSVTVKEVAEIAIRDRSRFRIRGDGSLGSSERRPGCFNIFHSPLGAKYKGLYAEHKKGNAYEGRNIPATQLG